MKTFLPCFFLAAGISCHAGDHDILPLKREVFKPGPSSLNFSPDGKWLLTGFMDGSFRLLDPVTFETEEEVTGAHDKPILAMDMPPKMDFILTAGGNMIKIWDRSGKHIGNFAGHATTIWDAEISGDGKYAVSSAFNKTFLLWDVYNGVIAAHMRGHEDVTPAVTISPDSKRIASGSNDYTIKIWDIENRQVIHTLQGPPGDILDVAFSPDGNLVAAASVNPAIRVYDVGQEKLCYLLKGHRGAVRKVAFSPDGRYLASVSEDKNLILWDVIKGERIHTFPDNKDMLLDVIFHPDGHSVYTISKAGELSRWDLGPEIFVLRYFEKPYLEELKADPIFSPRQDGESRKAYQMRMGKAELKKEDILDRYYRRYLEGRDE
jgi:WD40 repeat protein